MVRPTIARATPADAAGIVRALQRSEGATYFGSWMYDPQAVAEAIASERIISWIARYGPGDVIAHGALRFLARTLDSPTSPGDVAPSGAIEYGMAFTDPAHRGHGLAREIGAAALGWAGEHGIPELWMWTTTVAPQAQQALVTAGAQEMCLLLAMIPAGVNRGFDTTADEPAACMLFRLRLAAPPEHGTWFIPAAHQSLVSALLDGSPIEFRLPGPLEPAPSANLEVGAEYVPELKFAVLSPGEPAYGTSAELVRRTVAAAQQGANVTYLDLDPTSAPAMALAGVMAASGFAFAGIHPNYPTGRLRYRLQAPTSILQPREHISVVSERGAALLEHVWADLPAFREVP